MDHDNYFVSDSPRGPWLDFGAHTPQKALEVARSRMDWVTTYVAKMRPLKGEDILPELEYFMADIRERAAIQYGSQIVDGLESLMKDRKFPYHAFGSALDEHLLFGSDLYVPEKMFGFTGDEMVRPGQFGPIAPPKISLKEIM